MTPSGNSDTPRDDSRMARSMVRRLWQIERQLDGLRCDLSALRAGTDTPPVAAMLYQAGGAVASAARLINEPLSDSYANSGRC